MTQLFNCVEQRHVGTQGGELPKQQSVIPARKECPGQPRDIVNGESPFTEVFRYVFKVGIDGQDGGCRLLSPSRKAGKTISVVTDESEIVRNGFRMNSKLRHNCGLIQYDLRS